MASNEEILPLATSPNSLMTKYEILVIVAVSGLLLADAVELYLPGVITQSVACDLQLSRVTESILGVSIYFFLAVGTLISGFLGRKWGERRVLLVSLYMAVGSIIFCVLIPGFYTLLLSRALLGFATGLNFCIVHVFIGNLVRKEYNSIATVVGDFAYAIGTAWASFLGSFLLDRLGWRVFIAVVSLPLLILPIILFLFFIPNESDSDSESHQEDTTSVSYKAYFRIHLIKRYILDITTLFNGYSQILILPFLIQYTNNTTTQTGSCDNIVKGAEFLYLTAVGVANITGRVVGYFALKIVPFKLHLTLLAVLQIVCHGMSLIWLDINVIVPAQVIAKLCYSMSRIELAAQSCDRDFFGGNIHHLALAVSHSLSMLLATVGSGVVLMANSPYVLIMPLTMSIVMLVVSLSLEDYKR